MSDRPTPLQRMRYLAGRPLPDPMREWVRNDLLGPGNARRYFLRGLSMFIPLYVACVLIPGPLWLRLGMIALLSIPVVYFQIALRDVYRRHLLSTNGLDPNLVKHAHAEREDARRREYERRRGR
jgi:hypothetical protein